MKTLLFSLMLTLLLACQDQGVEPILPTRPEAPTNFVATLIAPDAIKLTWEHSGNADGFILSRGSRKFGWVGIDSIEADRRVYFDHFEGPIMFSGTGRVSYLIWAYNKVGESPMAISNEISTALLKKEVK